MKSNEKIWGFVTSLLLVFSFVLLFLNIFQYETALTTTGKGLFADYTGAETAFKIAGAGFSTFWMVANNVCSVIFSALAGVYIIIYILKVCGINLGKNFFKFEKVLSTLLALVAILTLVFGLGAVIFNRHESMGINGDIGFYFQCIGMLASFVSFLAIGNGKSTKKKGKRK